MLLGTKEFCHWDITLFTDISEKLTAFIFRVKK
jgi:hypothetical protein